MTAKLLASAAAFLCLTAAARAAPTEATIYSFKGGTADGSYPVSGVYQDADGALYGTVGTNGNSDATGIVYRLTPPKNGAGAWSETILARFAGKPAPSDPESGVIPDGKGGFYGVTQGGGTKDLGTVYHLTPPSSDKPDWTVTVLHSFQGGPLGASPRGKLIMGGAGALYGTTLSFDKNGTGIVFKLIPPAKPTGNWTLSVLYRFTGGKDGAHPRGGVTFGSGGVIYGTASSGGDANGNGVVFKLTPDGKVWKQTVLHTFTGGSDGGVPDPGVTLDSKTGTLYGTTYFGGATPAGSGVVYSLTPPKTASAKWTFKTLHAFAGEADGGHPYDGALTRGATGILYGTTQGFSASGDAGGLGTAYALAPPKTATGKWVQTVLHRFKSNKGGNGNPDSDLLLTKDGALFGTAYDDGAHGVGSVFKIVP